MLSFRPLYRFRLFQTGLACLLLVSCTGEPDRDADTTAASPELTATVDQALETVSALEKSLSSVGSQSPDVTAEARLNETGGESAGSTDPAELERMLEQAANLRDDGRFLEAENLYQEYFAGNGYAEVRAIEEYGHVLSRTGQFNEAIGMFNRARRLAPMSPRYTHLVAAHELYRGQYEEVRRLVDYGLGMEGGDFLFSALEWELAMRKDELDRAADLIRRYLDSPASGSGDAPVSRRFLEKFVDILELNDFEAATGDISALINDPSVTPLELSYVARLVALMGQPEIALDYWFGQVASPAIWDGVYDEMRRLPDFNRLLQEKGVVDYWRATGNWGDFCVPAGGRDFVCK